MSSHRLSLTVAALAVFAPPALHAQDGFGLINSFDVNGGGEGNAEIIAYTRDGFTLASTALGGVEIFNFADPRAVTQRAFVDFTASFGTASAFRDVSSTALDVLGRGFGAASLIPADNGGTIGKVGFYDYNTGAILGSLDVGFHPDSVLFSHDGTKLFVVNEGEYTTGDAFEAPGSLSIIDLSTVGGVGDIAGLGGAAVSTYDFSAANLDAALSLAGIRINDQSAFALANKDLFMEPEFASQSGDKLYVSLQENNVIAEFDLTSNQWTALHDLGTITQTIDASDRDGIDISDTLKGLPMPDTIATYEVGGVTFVVTANEGDFRVDDGDRTDRLGDVFDDGLIEGSILGLDYSNTGLGRIRAIADLSDTDGNGKLDDIVVPGTRSFSIWNAETGALVSDSGNLEELVALLDPLTFNMEDGDPSEFDGRSDAKGPEPEGLDVIEVDGAFWLVVGAERQNGLFFFDITDPTNPIFVDYLNDWEKGLISPESLLFIAAADSPTGRTLLLTGNEVSGNIGVYAVPEPAVLGLLSLPLLGSLLLLRRRR